MPTTVDPLRLRRLLGRRDYSIPQPFGPNGWKLHHLHGDGSVVVSAAVHDDNVEWIHASMARRDHVPSYDDLTRLHRAALPDNGWAYQVFAPPEQHINIHAHALHLWGRADGQAAMVDFGFLGTI